MTSEPTSLTALRIRDRRQAKGMTQRQLAAAAGLSVTVLRDLEQGVTSNPRPATIARLADALSIAPDELTLPGMRSPYAAEHLRQLDTLRLRVLGPLAAWRGTTMLALGPARHRALLSVLALHPGQFVHRDAIIALIWQFMPPPATAVAMIQNAVSRLRGVLAAPGAPSVLVTSGKQYQFASSHAVLDLTEYTRLADAASAARRRGDSRASWDLYDQALGLWSGDPVADIDMLQGTPMLTALRTRHASLIADYAEDASGHGEHARILPHLLGLTEREPYDERAHECLMIALAGIGNQGAAMETYERIRARLDDDLGIIPGDRLRNTQTRILRHDLIYQARPG